MAVARYALEGLPNKVLAAEYRMALPDEKVLATELEHTRRMLEGRQWGMNNELGFGLPCKSRNGTKLSYNLGIYDILR